MRTYKPLTKFVSDKTSKSTSRKFQIPIDELTNMINQLENEKTFSSQTALFQEICATKWAESFPFVLTPVVLASRVRQFKIPLKTPKCKHGKSPFISKFKS